MPERFSLTVLPVSVAVDHGFHVSLHVGPTLTPVGTAQDRLAAFPVFVDWPRALAGATITLFDQGGARIAAASLLDAIDPALWTAVFPADTPVRAPVTDTLEGRRWNTFAAQAVQDTARVATLLSVGQSAVVPPAPFSSLMGRAMASYVLDADLAKAMLSDRGGDILRRIGGALEDYDESAFVKRLDEYVAKVTDGNGAVKTPRRPTIESMLAQLHQARRFYERPDLLDADRYQERPDPTPVPPPPPARSQLPTPDPDFHDRIAHLADLPELLRKLGLVIDMEVRDLDRLAKAKALQAKIEIDGAGADAHLTAVVRAGTNLLARPANGDIAGGRLKLGDPSRFAVSTIDADGSALKTDRFVWTLPRLIRAQAQDKPVDAAPPALRAEGFTVVRHQKLGAVQAQVQRARGHVATRAAGGQVTLSAEDVTRGWRVEVWDASAARWFGLHERLLDIDVTGFGSVLTAVRSTGQLGGSNAVEDPGAVNPSLKLHEALFGWSGWSLAAPRPGPRVRNEGRDEAIDWNRDDDDRVTTVRARISVAPGTLPRLRYGRSYAFRAWSVDLAGNSPPHAPVVNAAPSGGAGAPAVSRSLSGQAANSDTLARHVDAIVGRQPRVAIAPAAATLRGVLPKAAAPASATELLRSGGRQVLDAIADLAPVTGVQAVDRMVADRLAARVSDRAFGATRQQLVEGAARPLLTEADLDTQPRWTAETLRPLAEAEIARDLDGLGPDVRMLADTVTPLLPFLRWDPIQPPVVVARHSFSEAESIRHLVIRSDVAPGIDGIQPIITDPTSYAADMAAKHPELDLQWRGTSERHLAPPKSHQMQCELHGRFDAALGSADDAARSRHLALALRDDGTLLDLTVSDLDDPLGPGTPQPGVSLGTSPTDAGPATDLATMARGAPLRPGEYVIHDVDQLTLPYLPDPLAAGLTLRFPDAADDVSLPPQLNVEAMRTDYRGTWPTTEPYRLVLSDGPQLSGRIDGNVISIALPPGRRLRLRLSSALRRDELPLLGIWDAFPPALRSNDLLAEAASDGWLWALTPAEEVTLVHAVPRPVEAPVPVMLLPVRARADTGTSFAGIVNCHAPSTDRVDVEARWTEWRDDLAQLRPTTEPKVAVACSIHVGEGEDPFVLAPFDYQGSVPGLGPIIGHKARHEFGDTRHRTVAYSLRGTTRFQEYFPPSLIASPDAVSLVGPETTLSIPSSAAPAAPRIHSILPLFRWNEETEPDQPFAVRRRRRAGLRLYLERPWFSSGEGELLGILLGGTAKSAGLASQWGADPVWLQRGPTDRALGLTIEDLWSASGFDAEPGANPRVRPLATAPSAEGLGDIGVLGYVPEFSDDRGLWFVDVAITPQAAYWPFVRLSVARYQPASLPGLELSPAVRCDFAQLTPERTMIVGRPDSRAVRITVSGPTGLRSIEGSRLLASGRGKEADLAALIGHNHRLLAKLERRMPEIGSDLGWRTDRVTELVPAGMAEDGAVTWLGRLDLPEEIEPARPGGSADWRVTVEEWEGIEADPKPFRLDGPLTTAWRLIYADRTML